MQQVAYYCCDNCNYTWLTGWDKTISIEEMNDACFECSVSQSNDHVVAQPYFVQFNIEQLQ